jgi:hypothetical protein
MRQFNTLSGGEVKPGMGMWGCYNNVGLTEGRDFVLTVWVIGVPVWVWVNAFEVEHVCVCVCVLVCVLV